MNIIYEYYFLTSYVFKVKKYLIFFELSSIKLEITPTNLCQDKKCKERNSTKPIINQNDER